MAGEKKVSKKATRKKSVKKVTISSQADLQASIDPEARKKAIAAVTQNPQALTLENLGWPFTEDCEVVLAAVKLNGTSLMCAHWSLQLDREIVLAAVKQYGAALEYAHESLRADRDVVLEAVKTTGWALEYASEDLRQDEELKKTAEG